MALQESQVGEINMNPNEGKEIKWVGTMTPDGKPRVTLMLNSLAYVPFPPHSWPEVSHFLYHWVVDRRGVVDAYVFLDNRFALMAFQTWSDRMALYSLLKAQKERGEERILPVSAFIKHFCDNSP